jgi:hypothetical protein
MKPNYLLSALCGVLAFDGAVRAQTPTLPSIFPGGAIVFEQSFTTGMLGFTTSQTARINVLNLNPVPATATAQPRNCIVELQFFDDKNNLVKQSVVPNFAPATAASLDLTRATVTSETAARAEIRGVVVINPTPTPVGSPAPTGFCTVMTTLEVFDNTTGSTVALTSDTRAVGTPNLFSVIAPPPK